MCSVQLNPHGGEKKKTSAFSPKSLKISDICITVLTENMKDIREFTKKKNEWQIERMQLKVYRINLNHSPAANSPPKMALLRSSPCRVQSAAPGICYN